MQDILNIVKGGVARKDLSPVLTHLNICNGWVTSTNGRMTITAKLPEMSEFDITVPADKFITAVKSCSLPQFKITPTGKLSIKGKNFRALLPLLSGIPFPKPEMRGEVVSSSNILEALKKISQFIGDDASRPWANGVLLYQNYAFATNNIILAETPVSWDGPAVNVPSYLISELLRINKDVKSIRATSENITFELEDDVWINSSLLDIKWPNVRQMLDGILFEDVPLVPDGLAAAIQSVLPFCPDKRLPKIILSEAGVSTEEGDHQASVQLDPMPESLWRAEPLLTVLDMRSGVTLKCDFAKYPKPCPWIRSDGVRGIMVGLKP